MKLNPDCVRDILIECENVCTVTTQATFEKDSQMTANGKEYEYEELFYHLRQCNENGYFIEIEDVLHRWGHYCFIKDISPKAHEFLAELRNPTVYDAVMEFANNKNIMPTLELMKDLASKKLYEIAGIELF